MQLVTVQIQVNGILEEYKEAGTVKEVLQNALKSFGAKMRDVKKIITPQNK